MEILALGWQAQLVTTSNTHTPLICEVPVKGQVLEGFVIRAANAVGSISEEALSERLVEAIEAIARPRRVHILTTMPRTRSGKIVRCLLRELVINGVTSGDASGLEDPEVLAQLERGLGGS